MADFLSAPLSAAAEIKCTRINVTEGVPTTRWGHSSASHDGKLYILGGRNEQDLIDLHEYNHEEGKWRNITVPGPQPKPRRRHSSIFVSGTLILFGGFDGTFYNDMHLLDIQKSERQSITISPPTID